VAADIAIFPKVILLQYKVEHLLPPEINILISVQWAQLMKYRKSNHILKILLLKSIKLQELGFHNNEEIFWKLLFALMNFNLDTLPAQCPSDIGMQEERFIIHILSFIFRQTQQYTN
jgi:hypothetical protein